MDKELTGSDIRQVQDIGIERVDVPEWGGFVYVRGMSGRERDAFEATIIEKRGRDFDVNLGNMRAKLAAWTIVNAAGERLFADEDVAMLAGKSGAALQRVFEVASRLSGLSTEDVDDLAKKSQGTA